MSNETQFALFILIKLNTQQSMRVFFLTRRFMTHP